jgi:hypothetical protein
MRTSFVAPTFSAVTSQAMTTPASAETDDA